MSLGTRPPVRLPVGWSSRVLRSGPLTESSTPGRLFRLGVALVAGCILTALVSLYGGLTRQAAIDDSEGRDSALSVDAGQLYRLFADADAMATSGYVAGRVEPELVRLRYDDDIEQASDRLGHAAGDLAEDDPGRALVAIVARDSPVYSGLIETARSANREGQPTGQSSLNTGSTLMRETVLPTVGRLRREAATALTNDYDRGGSVPFALLLVGGATLAGVIYVGVLETRRTNRIFNLGLVVSAGLIIVVLLWWIIASTIIGARLDAASEHGQAANALDDARAAILQARSDESLAVVARGDDPKAEADFASQVSNVFGSGGSTGLLGAASSAGGPDSARAIDLVRAQAQRWQQAHQRLRELNQAGQFADAAASVVGTDLAGSRVSFERLDVALGDALDQQHARLDDEAAGARHALTGLVLGPMLLSLLAAGAAGAGIAARWREYR